MTLEEIKSLVERLFRAAAEIAIHERPDEKNDALSSLKAICCKHFRELGFACMADCFAAAVPRVSGRLTLKAWSETELTVSPWTFHVVCRPFWLGNEQVYIAIDHDGPLPGITETGYRSIFAPIATFKDGVTPEEFIRGMFPQTAQMSLF